MYKHYWLRKTELSETIPYFKVRRWWPSDDFSEAERTFFDRVSQSPSVLDVGAGDLRIMRKFKHAKYGGEYHTQDISDDYHYTYRHLSEVNRKYGAILCLDVIEHLNLRDGLDLLSELIRLLSPGGVLVLQTPNARCVRHPLSWDMTHLHCYNLTDLWSYVTASGLVAEGYRIVFAPAKRTAMGFIRFAVGAFITTRLLGCDYADNILIIGRKPM